MEDKFGVFDNPIGEFNDRNNLSLDKDCLDAAKDEIKKTYGSIKFLPEFFRIQSVVFTTTSIIIWVHQKIQCLKVYSQLK